VVINAESIRKFVPARFIPTEGAPGSGSKAGGRGPGGNGLDLDRALSSGDLDYFDKHEKEIKEELRRRLG
jgi:hypothetical protein